MKVALFLCREELVSSLCWITWQRRTNLSFLYWSLAERKLVCSLCWSSRGKPWEETNFNPILYENLIAKIVCLLSGGGDHLFLCGKDVVFTCWITRMRNLPLLSEKKHLFFLSEEDHGFFLVKEKELCWSSREEELAYIVVSGREKHGLFCWCSIEGSFCFCQIFIVFISSKDRGEKRMTKYFLWKSSFFNLFLISENHHLCLLT